MIFVVPGDRDWQRAPPESQQEKKHQGARDGRQKGCARGGLSFSRSLGLAGDLGAPDLVADRADLSPSYVCRGR